MDAFLPDVYLECFTGEIIVFSKLNEPNIPRNNLLQNILQNILVETKLKCESNFFSCIMSPIS